MEPTTVERPNTSLFGIHSQLLELYELREDTAADDPASLPAIDKAIDEYIALEARKVDSTIIVMRQFAAAVEFNKAEADRYRGRAKMFARNCDDIEQRLIRFMQTNRLTVMEGKTARLKLAKNPASVEPRQPELIPDRFMRIDVTLSAKEWCAIVDCLLFVAERAALDNDGRCEAYEALATTLQSAINHAPAHPDLIPIKKEMQSPCEHCKGSGQTLILKELVQCSVCAGSGKRAVPGCELVTDKVRLAVS